MTQLIIAGVEVVLPQQFSVTVKRENSFFTKNGEYTYDCTLRLDNPVNQQLYGFLHRLNKSGQVATRRTAILMADGRVYCRGTEVVTKWTDQTVSVQIVSGESELNFFIGQEQKIEELDLGVLTYHREEHDNGSRTNPQTYTYTVFDEDGVYPEKDYCCVTVRLPNGSYVNRNRPWMYFGSPDCPQPYLCLIIRRLMTALGYTIGLNQLEDTQFKNLFLVNTIPTSQLAKTLPGWTVKDFLTEVERLTGIVFITDNSQPGSLHVDILLKSTYYQQARQLPLQNVVDSYELEVSDDGDAEFTSSNVSYDLPDSYWKNLYKLPEGFMDQATVIDYVSLDAIMRAPIFSTDPSIVYRDASTGRRYVRVVRELDAGLGTEVFWQEIDQYGDLKRQGATSELELKMTPAPMGYDGGIEFIDLGTTDPAYTETGIAEVLPEEDEEEGEASKNAIDIIRGYSSDESAAIDLYCAFFTGTEGHTVPYVPGRIGRSYNVAFTDAYHACLQLQLHNNSDSFTLDTDLIVGSLRLADLDADHYQGGYQIDTRHAVTFETFDPNRIDVRQVYLINNKRYVVRDVEETITAEGRQPLWRLTCFPITITDEAIENRWILTRGVWDDGGAWLDDGRWNDTPQ